MVRWPGTHDLTWDYLTAHRNVLLSVGIIKAARNDTFVQAMSDAGLGGYTVYIHTKLEVEEFCYSTRPI
jgi:hypothetical protein